MCSNHMDLKKKVDKLEIEVAELKDMFKMLYEESKNKDEIIKRLREYNAKCK